MSALNADYGTQGVISTIGDLDGEEYLGEEPGPKKWVIYDMVKLGFEEAQIIEAIEFMETLPEELSREQLMNQVAEKFAGKVASLNEIIEKWEKNELKEEKLPRVVDAVAIEIQKTKTEDVLEKKEVKEKKELKKAKEEVKEVKEAKIFQKSVTCQVCFNYYSEEEVKPVLKCKHAFCKSCYQFYIEQLIKVNKVRIYNDLKVMLDRSWI